MPKSLSDSEVEQLLSALRSQSVRAKRTTRRDAAACLLGLLGLRISEIKNLTVGCLNHAEKTLAVKTLKGGRHRTIPLDDHLVAELVHQSGGRSDEQPLLPQLDQRNLRRRWAEWCVEILGRNIRFHDLRHTFARWMKRHGTDIFGVQRMLGHKKTETTSGYLETIDDLRPRMPGAD